MKHSAQIDPGHPALAGHFPGNPIVPGVVLLDLAIAAFCTEQGHPCAIQKILSVKFLSPLQPGVTVNFSFDISNHVAQFTGKSGERTIISGQMEFSLEP